MNWSPLGLAGSLRQMKPSQFRLMAALGEAEAEAAAICSNLALPDRLLNQPALIEALRDMSGRFARVVKAGRTLVITRGEVHAEQAGKRTLVAIMQQTLMVMHGVADEQI